MNTQLTGPDGYAEIVMGRHSIIVGWRKLGDRLGRYEVFNKRDRTEALKFAEKKVGLSN